MARNSNNIDLRQKILKPKASVDKVKDALRKQFHNRIKQLRNEILNSSRNLVDDLDNLEIIENSEVIRSSGLNTAEILELLEEVEREMRLEQLKMEGDQYERDNNDIIEDMLSDTLNCAVCNKITSKINRICFECNQTFSM